MTPILGVFGSSVQKASGAFESIATATPSAGDLSVTFSSIPQTYQSLQIRFRSRSTDPNSGPQDVLLRIRYNGISTNTYWNHRLMGNGSALASADLTQSGILIGGNPRAAYNANIFGVGIINIEEYTSSSKTKALRAFCGIENNSGSSQSAVSQWSGASTATTALTSITILDASTWGFASGTQFALYGIKGA